MVTFATKLIHIPVIDPDSEKRIGEVSFCVFDADKGVLCALQIKTTGLLPETRYVSFYDVVSFERYAIIAREETLLSLAELPRIAEIIETKRPIIKQPCITKSRNPLGTVEEIVFDLTSGRITQLYIKSLFRRRIIGYGDVDHITKRAVIVHDEVTKIPIAEAARVPIGAKPI